MHYNTFYIFWGFCNKYLLSYVSCLNSSLCTTCRSCRHSVWPGQKKRNIWKKPDTSKEAKNLPAAGMGGPAGCHSHHPGDCCPDFTGPLFLPPSRRSGRRRMWVKQLSWHRFFFKCSSFTSTNTRPHLCLVPPLLLMTTNGCNCTGLLDHLLWHSGTNTFTLPCIYAQFLIGETHLVCNLLQETK